MTDKVEEIYTNTQNTLYDNYKYHTLSKQAIEQSKGMPTIVMFFVILGIFFSILIGYIVYIYNKRKRLIGSKEANYRVCSSIYYL